MLCALIMAGGKGTRFWPLSTEEKPKQFLTLVNDKTMIQMTVDRIKQLIPMERIFICTGEKYVDLVQEQIPELDKKNIIIEPEGKNTAPCIAISALYIKRRYNDATMLILPSDHLINDEKKFLEIVMSGEEYLKHDNRAIVTLGMSPDRPETGYGYIKLTEEEKIILNNKITKVDKFVEKPTKEVALEYLKSGKYLWNGGMFLWTVDNIINLIEKYLPNTYDALNEVLVIEDDFIQEYINKNYKYVDAISIDYAILENYNNIFVIPSNIGWDDIGTWKAVERYRDKDVNNNIATENVMMIESKSNMAINLNKKIVLIGMKDTMAVETDDTIFIVNKNCMEDLKNYKEMI